jgi:hypothetical protein
LTTAGNPVPGIERWRAPNANRSHLVRFEDHVLARFELGFRAGQMRDEATVETLEIPVTR